MKILEDAVFALLLKEVDRDLKGLTAKITRLTDRMEPEPELEFHVEDLRMKCEQMTDSVHRLKRKVRQLAKEGK